MDTEPTSPWGWGDWLHIGLFTKEVAEGITNSSKTEKAVCSLAAVGALQEERDYELDLADDSTFKWELPKG